MTVALIETLRPEFVGMFNADLILTGHRPIPETAIPIRPAWWTGVKTALRQRRLARQGAARQRGLIRGHRELATVLAQRIPIEAEHLVIDAVLLPHLAHLGVLGGRTYDVLLARLPMADLQATLDEAASRYPDRATLADFRAPAELVEKEWEALQGAAKIVTAHAQVASLFGDRADLVPWPRPACLPWKPGDAILFPGPVVARKGAYEVREVAKRLGKPVIVGGRSLEGEEFWSGVETRVTLPNWLEGAAVVVQPSWLEERPVRLLVALQSGCPVVATPACGLPPQPGLILVPPGDPNALEAAIRSVYAGRT